MKYLFSILLLLIPFAIFAQIPTKCFEIESILVDACDGGLSIEGKNEMVRFVVGPLPINVSNLSVAGGMGTVYTANKWPTGNNFLGIANPPANIAKIDSINATITACGRLIEPANGILLPGMKVLLITSTDFITLAQSFTNLVDTLYVIFQNSINPGGNFSNYTGGTPTSNRNFVLVNTATGCADTVKYKPSLLTTQSGNGDGDAVSYAWDGTPTYYNNGCQAPFNPSDPSWTAPAPMCADADTINLNSLITGNTGGVWSGTGVAGNIFNPANAIGSDTITYTLGTLSCQSTETHVITVIALSSAAWALPDSICASEPAIDLTPLVSGTPGGTWTGSGVSGSNFTPGGLSGYVPITYTVGQAPCTVSKSDTIYVKPAPTAAWDAPDTLCDNASPINLNNLLVSSGGTPGGIWTIDGVTDSIFDPAGQFGPIIINYTIGTLPCLASETHTIRVMTLPIAAWSAPSQLCQANAPLNLDSLRPLTSTPGGFWSGTGVTGNHFNPAGLDTVVSITYTVGTTPCVQTESHSINVVASANANWTAPDTVCVSSTPIDLNTLINPGGTTGGIWAWSGVGGNMFNPSGLSGNVSITYTVGVTPCNASVTHTIYVAPLPNAHWTKPAVQCQTSPSINLSPLVTGIQNGTWSGNGVSGHTFSPAGLQGKVPVSYTVTQSGCTATYTDTIMVFAPPQVALKTPDTLCKSDEKFNLNQLIIGTFGGKWTGQYVTDNNLYLYNVKDSVRVTYTLANPGCTTIVSKTIRIDLIDASFNVDPVEGEAPLPVAIANTTSGAISYAWNFGNNTTSVESNPSITYDKEGKYMINLTATSSNSCISKDSLSVEVFESKITIPNVFTPNGDLKNETFYPEIKRTVNDYNLIIFNRWGKKIFTSTDQKIGWDGNNSANGVYYYIITYSLPNKKMTYNGIVTLIR